MVGNKIGRRLQEQRKSKGLTQEALARMIGVTPNYLSAVERGIHLLNYDTLVAAMNCIGCSADDIFCDIVDHSTHRRAVALADRIEAMPWQERIHVLNILEILLKKSNCK